MADDGDAELLADLGRRTFHETFAASNKAEDMDAYSEAAFAIDRIVGELRQEATAFFIAETPTKPVGFAKLEAARPAAVRHGAVPGPAAQAVRLGGRHRHRRGGGVDAVRDRLGHGGGPREHVARGLGA